MFHHSWSCICSIISGLVKYFHCSWSSTCSIQASQLLPSQMVKHFFHNIWSGQILFYPLCVGTLLMVGGACMSQGLWELYRRVLKPNQAVLRGGTRLNLAHGPPGWWLDVGLTTPPRKNKSCYGNYDNYNNHKGPHSRLEPYIWQDDHICSKPTPGRQGCER